MNCLKGSSQFVYFVLTICFMTCLPFLSCNTANKEATDGKKYLVLKSDSGYVSKSDALEFLIANHLTDTLDDYWKIRFPGDEDTIGKYYPSNTNGNIILLVKLMDYNKAFERLVLMEISKDGLLLGHTAYDVTDDRCEDAVRSFRKNGKYFIITGCGHGSGLGWGYGYVFDHVVQEGLLNSIGFTGFCATYWANPDQSQRITSTMETDDTSVLLHYTIMTGWNNRGDEIQWQPPIKADVRYTWEDDHWITKDSALLDRFCLD